MHRVVVLAVEDVVAFDLAIAAQVFGSPARDLGERHYAFAVCAAAPGPVRTSTGFSLLVDHGLEALAGAGTVVVPGIDRTEDAAPAEVLEALRTAHRRGARIVSICTGAFVLAAAGLLAGRRATTHWQYAALLARLHPDVEDDPDVLYVDDGDVLTSAGVAAGIDLCLHIVRSDHGAEVANAVARRIVVAPHRDGGQAQFAQRPVPAAAETGLAATRTWMLERLHEPLTVARMARHAGYADRSFARIFRAETGMSPLQWLIGQRVLEARRLLEATALPVEDVAARSGFGSAASLRQHLRRHAATTPTAYRRAFGGGP
jgi:transcriptional regulator GlxA family with amidase domain